MLLSTVDHYNRVAKDTKKRVVGVLLGSRYKGVVDVTNRYVDPLSRGGIFDSVVLCFVHFFVLFCVYAA